jgi:hypothetical protein
MKSYPVFPIFNSFGRRPRGKYDYRPLISILQVINVSIYD